MNWLITTVLSIFLVEFLLRLPLRDPIADAAKIAAKAQHTLLTSAISDHWKERALLAYAGRLFRNTLTIAIALGAFTTVAVVLIVIAEFAGVLSRGFIFGWPALLYSAVFATIYVSVRKRMATPKNNYTLLDRLLHRLALQSSSVAEMSFDIDQTRVSVDSADVASRRHVFVAGLARAGTTILMRQFYATGRYCSLTYRDMPFVLAPNLWRQLSSVSSVAASDVERAHGDNLSVSVDSPESFDEVFWRVFAGAQYIHDNCLEPHRPSRKLIEKYVRYVGAVLDGKALYLCKNNNNILRLEAIRRAFPEALIVVPFRDPLQHAASLLRQHRRFAEMQSGDSFIRDYMRWLGHHEFGLDHRPFRFDDLPKSDLEPDTIDYWLELWCRTYAWLERTAPDSVLFVSYEDLCTDERTWSRIALAAGIPTDPACKPSFRLSHRNDVAQADEQLTRDAAKIYARLAEISRARLKV